MVSSDGHIGAPLEVYREYVDPQYRTAYGEWMAANREGEKILSASWFGNQEMPGRRRPFIAEDPKDGLTVTEVCDPNVRTAALEAEGVVAEVLFPGPDFARSLAFPFGTTDAKFDGKAGRLPLGDTLFNADIRAGDLELGAAGERAYNRWLADYCGEVPGRALGIMHPPRHDMGAAVRELEWGRTAGLRGIQLPSDDPRLPPYWDEHWEPLWSACEDLELPVHFHGATSHGTDHGLPEGNEDVSRQVVAVELSFWMTRPLKILIYAEVLERHPRLKLVFTELTCDWVPSTVARMEQFHRDTSLRGTNTVRLPRPPSEYWYRQCYIGASLLSRDEVLLRDPIGVENMMYGVDYPHPEGSWMRTKEWLQQVFGQTGITERDLRRVLGENAVELYGLDVDQLRPIAERVGPSYGEIVNASPREQSEWGEKFAYMPGPYRTAGPLPGVKVGAV
jgi:predicted TIM-barrel fold metal-dependent hydrolase